MTMTKEERAWLRAAIAQDRAATAAAWAGSARVLRTTVSVPWVHETETLLDALDAAERERDEMRADLVAVPDANGDRDDQWTDAIEAAHPTRLPFDSPEWKAAHARCDVARQMVSNRHSKQSLVVLVNWLLTRADAAEARAERIRADTIADVRAALERIETFPTKTGRPALLTMDVRDALDMLADAEREADNE